MRSCIKARETDRGAENAVEHAVVHGDGAADHSHHHHSALPPQLRVRPEEGFEGGTERDWE
eukprot:1061615-Rhodomonas_salina.1